MIFRVSAAASTVVFLFSLRASGETVDLTGVWKSDDGGTYYIRQDRDKIWWAGVSGDDAQHWCNVFLGRWRPNEATEEPANRGWVEGEWADVPRGKSAQNGRLKLSYEFNGQLRKQSFDSPFGGRVFRKLTDDEAGREPEVRATLVPGFEDQELTGIWKPEGRPGTFYWRRIGNVVWWLGLSSTEESPSIDADVFRGIVRGDQIIGEFAVIPWRNTSAPHTGRLTLIGAGGHYSSTRDSAFPYQDVSWNRVHIGRPVR